jgi:hypothetical protein
MQGSKKAAGFLALLLVTVLLTACPSQTNISKINRRSGSLSRQGGRHRGQSYQ